MPRLPIATAVRSLATAILAIASAVTSATAQPPSVGPQPAGEDWRETYAYTQGLQAFVFGFPWVFLPQIRKRRDEVFTESDA